MKTWFGLTIGVACISALANAAATQGAPALPPSSIDAREQAVYEAVLASWFGGADARQLVSLELGPPPSISDADVKECARGLRFPPATFARRSGNSLGGVRFSGSRIELVDPSHWSVHDPGQGIAGGKSVDAAVEEGISHSLLSFSQVDFTKDGKDALVSFSMVCGSLCGSGSTLHLHETRGRWAIVNRCRNWIS